MQLAVLLEPFHGHEAPAVGLHGKHRARLHGTALPQHGARAAVRGVAPDVRPRQPQDVADQVDEQEPRLDVRLVLLAIDRELDPHDLPPSFARLERRGPTPATFCGSPYPPSARPPPSRTARAVQTPARSLLYTPEPPRSSPCSPPPPAT